MTIADIKSREPVLQAIAEFDRLPQHRSEAIIVRLTGVHCDRRRTLRRLQAQNHCYHAGCYPHD